jgi:hypothetical protein
MKRIRKHKPTPATWAFIGAILIAGPFALPLLWTNRRFTQTTKIVWTTVTLAVTALFWFFSAKIGQAVIEFTQP